MKRKDTRINIRVSTELAEKLAKAAVVLDIPASQITREAVSEKLLELAKADPRVKRALAA